MPCEEARGFKGGGRRECWGGILLKRGGGGLDPCSEDDHSSLDDGDYCSIR